AASRGAAEWIHRSGDSAGRRTPGEPVFCGETDTQGSRSQISISSGQYCTDIDGIFCTHLTVFGNFWMDVPRFYNKDWAFISGRGNDANHYLMGFITLTRHGS
ncbi:MAG: hypothetical protein ABEI31_03820, partial [Halodesulfurarchaeum sp.]